MQGAVAPFWSPDSRFYHNHPQLEQIRLSLYP